MQDYEKPRYQAALTAFSKAFVSGYDQGKQERTEKKAALLPGVDSVFYIDVPRNDVLDGEHGPHEHRFQMAGRMAALAERRNGEAKLDTYLADPEGRHATETNDLRWTVILNPTS